MGKKIFLENKENDMQIDSEKIDDSSMKSKVAYEGRILYLESENFNPMTLEREVKYK